MIYLVIKSLHITSVIIWMSVMIITPVFLRIISEYNKNTPSNLGSSTRALFHRIATPSMFATLIFGLWLLSTGDWMQSRWMILKLTLVVLLTGIHGAISGQLRQFEKHGNCMLVERVSLICGAQITIILLIVLLVVTKAF